MGNPKGKRRTMWLPNDLDAKVEKIREKLGLGRSGFYRYAVVEIVKQYTLFQKREEPCQAVSS